MVTPVIRIKMQYVRIISEIYRIWISSILDCGQLFFVKENSLMVRLVSELPMLRPETVWLIVRWSRS